jgi:hypothetical protein
MVNYATDMEMTKFLKCLLIGIFNLSLRYAAYITVKQMAWIKCILEQNKNSIACVILYGSEWASCCLAQS